MAAFAARADGPLGTVGSLVGLGGIWNALAAPPGVGSWAGWPGSRWCWRWPWAGCRCWGGAGLRGGGGLLAAAGAGLLLAAAPALPGLRGLAELVVTQLPGAA